MVYGRLFRFKNQLHASWKWLLSFRTKDWCLEDYPVTIRKQEANLDSVFNPPRFTQHGYIAHIVNWALTGGGETPSDAKEKLRENFEMVKGRWLLEGRPLVRPGTLGPIEFAPQINVNTHEALSEDFIRRVLGLEWAWISDESSLWDFHAERDNEQFNAKIREIYGVDVSDIQSGRLCEIFDRIANSQTTAPD